MNKLKAKLKIKKVQLKGGKLKKKSPKSKLLKFVKSEIKRIKKALKASKKKGAKKIKPKKKKAMKK